VYTIWEDCRGTGSSGPIVDDGHFVLLNQCIIGKARCILGGGSLSFIVAPFLYSTREPLQRRQAVKMWSKCHPYSSCSISSTIFASFVTLCLSGLRFVVVSTPGEYIYFVQVVPSIVQYFEGTYSHTIVILNRKAFYSQQVSEPMAAYKRDV
jgi:hypothetical protein